MSTFKFGQFSKQIDFTDAEFCDALERAAQALKDETGNIKESGTLQSVIRAQCAAIWRYFDRLMGEGASEKMFGGKVNARLCNKAVAAFMEAKENDLKQYVDETQQLTDKMVKVK